jgi:PAS domain S-box-containing protein
LGDESEVFVKAFSIIAAMVNKHTNQSSLANRIMAIVMGINLILAISLFSFFVFRFQQIDKKNQELVRDTFIASVAMGAEMALNNNNPDFLKQIFSYLMEKPRVAYIAVYTADGTILRQEMKHDMNLSIPEEQFTKHLARKKHSLRNAFSIPHGYINEHFSPVLTNVSSETAQATTIGLVRLGTMPSKTPSPIKQIIIFTGLTAIVVLIAGALFTLFMSRRITKPLAQLEEGAKRISSGELDFEIQVKSDDEIVSLANTFNSMSRALKESTVSRGYLDNILESMIDTMIVVDTKGNIQTANHALAQLSGYSRDELIGMSFTELLDDGADNSILEGGIDGLIERGSIHNYELHYVTKDGIKVPMSFSGSVLHDFGGNIIGFTCVAQDISRRKSTESELRRRMSDIEKFNKFMLGREKRILEVKREVNELLQKNGEPPKYSC